MSNTSPQSDLQVITFAKNLCSYIMTITQKSPKQFRFSLIGRMQNYTMDIIEELYFANEIFVKPENKTALIQRREHQRRAMSRLKLLVYVAQLSMEQGAIQPKQFEQICLPACGYENHMSYGNTWKMRNKREGVFNEYE